MKQLSLAATDFVKKPKQTRREKFLSEMESVVPWTRLLAAIEPFYPKAGNGRRPYELPTMLRIHFMQHWFSYSDAAMEEALHDMPLLRRFSGLDAGSDTLPDETTILNFRHLLQSHGLSSRLLAEVNALLTEKGLLLREGTTVDATLIAAPPSTKNRDGKRDPEMTQTKKGNQWYFGMKAHIGVDAASGLTHTLIGTAANAGDVTQAQALLHGDETDVFGDAGYQGVEKRAENLEVPVRWHIALKRSVRKAGNTD